ncbi:MAG: UDP-N-acetylmuramoyl-L-alanine--D-glutamate ligase [Patescibacteria group bacterium]|nr:UDP-N-acetylmuramoyl-L-alanine--D-glutamate ligase [Patescibacteria group bacterium]
MKIVKNILKSLNNRKIAMLGLGVENLALVKYLLRRSPAAETAAGQGLHITVCDPKSAAELGDRYLEIKQLAKKNKLPEIILMTGKNYDAHLADFDIIFRSPGYPLFNPNLLKAKKAGVIISSPMKLFFELCPTKNIIGVTGSKGKGTTSSLIYEILKKATTTPGTTPKPLLRKEGRVWLGGNIGNAPFEFIEKIKPKDFVVLELSSFQLEDLDVSPHIAVVTNLFKEHLAPADPNNPNYHRSMKDYWAAKANIFSHQQKNDYLVINEKLKNKIPLSRGVAAPRGRGVLNGGTKVIFCSSSALPSNLIGAHNKENLAAAEAVAKILKIKPEIVARAVKNFQGLPHRLEFVAEINGVRYFDDSFATVPDVSVIALKAVGGKSPLERPTYAKAPVGQGWPTLKEIACPTKLRRGAKLEGVLKLGGSKSEIASRGARNDKNIILLAGGADKGSDFKKFAQEITKRVKYLILFKGKGTDRLKKELQITNYKFPIIAVDTMKKAVEIARREAELGDVILLSTGCASFGCFKNYKERGDFFKEETLKNK